MTSLTYSHLDDVTRVILAAELSTQREFKGMGRSNPALLQIATDMILSDYSIRYKAKVDSAQVIANALWWDHFKPKLLDMLETVCADRKHAEAVLLKHFDDRGFEYRG